MSDTLRDRIERVMRAREIVCPSIIVCFHNTQRGFADGTLVIDYIGEQYQKKSQVIGDFIFHGNNTDKVKGYGNDFTFDPANPEFHVVYYFDVSSYLFDPEMNAPYNSRATCYHEINLDNRQDIRDVLVEFQSYLERLEDESAGPMDPDEDSIFSRAEFNSPNEVNSILNNNERLNSFNQLINESSYFDSNLF